MQSDASETQAVLSRYARRRVGDLYSVLRPDVWQSIQERQRATLRLFAETLGWDQLKGRKVIEVGCGTGSALLEFIRLGFDAEDCAGIELIPERAAQARSRLPEAVTVYEGDALGVPYPTQGADIVYQALVFSSLLDDAFQQRLADAMWSWVKPGGGILWYDFVYDNPGNRDVRAVPVSRVRQLFPQAQITTRRITLAPPISRRVCRLTPLAYPVFNALPVLRTHALCWIGKPAA